MSKILEFIDVNAGYGRIQILNDLSFSVEPGEYLCVIGENGSGKTTLMRTVLGLQKPLRGSVSFGDGLRESGIGYLPQRTDVQKDFPAAVREVVLSGCQARLGRKPFYSREDKKRAEENMEKMGISAREALFPGAVRRPAAARTAGPGALRHRQTVIPGRTGLGAGSARHR